MTLMKSRFGGCFGIGKVAMVSGMNPRAAQLRCSRMACWILAALSLVAGAAETAEDIPRFTVDVWTADDGLPSSAVTGLAQTSEGYLWIGTHKGGLVRFDGMEFKRPTHTANPPLPGREVTMLEVDGNGTMWVEQEGPYRLISYQNGVFTNRYQPPPVTPVHFRQVASVSDDEVLLVTTKGALARIGGRQGTSEAKLLDLPFPLALRCGSLQGDGGVWLRSDPGDFGFLENGKFTAQTKDADGPGWPVHVMARGPDGRMWVGSGQGLAVMEAGKFRRIVPEGLKVVPPVFQIAFSGDGGMWVRTETRIMKELKGRWVVDVEPWSGGRGPLNADFPLHGDAGGGAWLPEAGRGLWHVDADGGLASIGTAEGLPGTVVSAWLQDREGGIWVGTQGGLARLRPHLFDVVGPAQGLLQPVVRSISEDASGAIWLSSASGLTRWQDGRCEEIPLQLPEGFAPLTDALVAANPSNREDPLWIGTVGGGAFQWQDGALIHPFEPRKVGQAVRAILRDSKGATWFGGEFGLFRWDGSELVRFNQSQGLRPGHIYDIREGSNGDIWLGNAGAHLTRYRDGRFENWQEKGLEDLPVYAILPDGDDAVWLGSLGDGLLRWRDGKFFRYTTEHGLPSDTVTQLLDDGMGHLWGGTRQGIFRVEKQALHEVAAGLAKHAAFKLFGRDDGLPSTECSGGMQPAALHASDGRLWFSTVRGAVAVDPAAVKSKGMPPPASIEEVRLDGVVLANNQAADGKHFNLPPGPHTLEFRFTGLTLVAPERVRFRWRMSGVDDGWVDGGFQRSVIYGGMLPGTYQFEVRACNQDGVWNRQGAVFGFSIKPRFWERDGFQVVMVITLVSAAAGMVAAFQRRKYRRKMARVESRRALEAERTRIARDLHDDLGAGLAQINISSGLVATEGIDPSFIPPLLQGIGTRSRELIAALDEIVWAINPKNDTLSSLATYLCQYAKNFLNPAQIACRLKVDPGLPDLPLAAEQRHGLFLAFAEALHNAVSHSGASEVRVGIAFGAGVIHLSVADNGRGLPAGEPAPGADGLANMQERLTQLGGSCRISNPPGGGTEVAFHLPLRSAPRNGR